MKKRSEIIGTNEKYELKRPFNETAFKGGNIWMIKLQK